MPVGRISCSATRVEWRSSHGARRRRDEHELRHLREELVEAKRAVVERRRQAEAEVDERLLARPVALVHAADLRDRLVRLVDEDDEVGREVVEQRVRRRARRAAVEDARVVLDPVAEPELLHHLEVVLGALADPVRLEHPALRLELLHLRLELGAISTTARSIVGFEVTYCVAGKTVIVSSRESTSPVSGSKCVIASTSSPKNEIAVRGLGVGGLELEHVALDAEPAAAEQRVVADVLDVDQLAQDEVAILLLADGEEDDASARTPPASRGRRCTRPRRR